MALTRKFLTALGIDEEKSEQIIVAHGDTVDGLKAERDKYKEDAEKLPIVQKELNDLKAQVSGEDPYKEKFEALQKDFDAYKAEISEKEITAKKTSEFRRMLLDIGIPEKRIDMVLKVSDINKIEFDDEGKIKDGEKIKENLKTEWSDFIPTKLVEGVPSANPPSNTGKTTMTKEQIRAIPDASARQKAMLENPSLFGLPESN